MEIRQLVAGCKYAISVLLCLPSAGLEDHRTRETLNLDWELTSALLWGLLFIWKGTVLWKGMAIQTLCKSLSVPPFISQIPIEMAGWVPQLTFLSADFAYISDKILSSPAPSGHPSLLLSLENRTSSLQYPTLPPHMYVWGFSNCLLH